MRSKESGVSQIIVRLNAVSKTIKDMQTSWNETAISEKNVSEMELVSIKGRGTCNRRRGR